MPSMRALSSWAIPLLLYGWFAAAPVSACQQDALGGKTCFALAALHGGPGEDLNFCEDSQDWVTFNACAGRSYVIATSALGSAADTVLEVYGPDCSTLIASDDNGGGGLQSRIHWITPANGPYHLHARQADGSFGENRDYHLRITGDTSPCETAARRSAFSGTMLKDPHAAFLADGGWIATLDRYISGAPTNPSVARYRADGSLAWIEELGTSASRERATRVLQTSDGGFLVAAFIDNPPLPPRAWLAKLDGAGSLQWSKWGAMDTVRDLAPTREGGVLLVGALERVEVGSGKSLTTRRLDAAGVTTSWCSYDIGPDPNEYADQAGWAVRETRDGGTLVAGAQAWFVGFPLGPFLMRLGPNGTPLWAYNYSSTGDTVRWVTETPDGNIYFVSDDGVSGSASLVKLTASGDVLWGRSIGGAGVVTGLVGTDDNGVVLSATISGSAAFVKIDGAGNVFWAARYGTSGVMPTLGILGIGPDGGLRVAGWRNTSSGSGGGLLMLATNGSGLIPGCPQSSVWAVSTAQVTVTRQSPGSIRSYCSPGDSAQSVAASAAAPLTSSTECSCSAPSSYSGSLSVDRIGGASRVSWTAGGATRYDVVRGSLSVLHDSGGDLGAALDALPGEACLANDVTALFADDLHPEPGAGDGRFYLLRSVDNLCLAPGTYDEASPSQVLPRDPSIEKSTAACP
jgi:hypothetical protein